MIIVTVFHSILNQMEFHLVQNRKENCHHDHILFNVKGNGNKVFSVQRDIDMQQLHARGEYGCGQAEERMLSGTLSCTEKTILPIPFALNGI